MSNTLFVFKNMHFGHRYGDGETWRSSGRRHFRIGASKKFSFVARFCVGERKNFCSLCPYRIPESNFSTSAAFSTFPMETTFSLTTIAGILFKKRLYS